MIIDDVLAMCAHVLEGPKDRRVRSVLGAGPRYPTSSHAITLRFINLS